jgi:enterochelin esterase-like enzyme
MKKLNANATFILIFYLLTTSGYSQTSDESGTGPMEFKCTTETVYVYSPGLEGNLLGDPSTQPAGVILPPGYELYPENRYPVVYFLHGGTQDYSTFTLSLVQKLNSLISKRIIAPMILITPNGNNAYGGSFFTNSSVSGNWEDFIVTDVVQYIENTYRVLDQRDSRGLSGYSMGGFGTISIGMKYPSKIGSIIPIGSGKFDFEIFMDLAKEDFISAAEIGEYRASDPINIRICFAEAVAFSPDSTAKSFCRLPYNAEGMRIDSIWRKWLMHDPLTQLPTYKDSLLKLNNIQIYVGESDPFTVSGESYHRALIDQGIDHGFEKYAGGHDPEPVLDDMLVFFSDHLTGIVPTIRTYSDYYLENSDTLVIETDMEGKLYTVPYLSTPATDSIFKYKIAVTEVMADEKNEFQLSGFEYGRYLVFTESKDSTISNIPVEYWVVPDASVPEVLAMDTVHQGDSIRVSCSKDGTLALMSCIRSRCPRLSTVTEIIRPPYSSLLIDSLTVLADQEVSFSTDNLSPGSYMIYGWDQYGIVSEPSILQVIEGPVGISNICPPEIELFPNPANKVVTLFTHHHGLYNLTISSINGKLIHSSQTEGTTHQIDLSSFQKGVYFITIRSKDFMTTRKIIKY